MAGNYRRIIRILCILILIAVILLIAFRWRFHKPILDLAEVHIRNAASELIEQAVTNQIQQDPEKFNQIVYFEKDLSGHITAMKTNMNAMNQLKSGALRAVNSGIPLLDSSDLDISIGSLLFPVFSGRKGPRIPVRILALQNADAAFESGFRDAGINQTLHQLSMYVNMDITALIFGETETFHVSAQVIVAETVIVGQVPGTILHTGGYYGS